jgi:LPS-assembly protein
MSRLLRAAILVTGLALSGHAPAFAQATAVRTADGEVTVLADKIEQFEGDDLVVATGNVEIVRGAARLTADRVELNRQTGDVVAQGRAIFYDGDNQLRGPRIDYNYRTGTGVVHDGEARTAPYYRIAGERMERLGEGIYRVRRGVFTTCEDDPPTWSFRAGSVDADMNDLLYGTGGSFWVKSVPVVPFIPFFAAALRRERQTGFLFPLVGTSSRKGRFAEIPFYWAISDSMDATITLHAYEQRGIGAHLEYRYLLSATHQGTVTGFYLRETEVDDDNRGWYGVKHTWALAPGLSLKADINGVSDDLIFQEYADRLHDRSLQRVESNVFLTKTWPTWNLVGNLFWYEDLIQQRAVELNRLPEVRLNASRQPLPGPLPGFLYELESSFVNFEREIGSDGRRVDVHPRLSRPTSVAGFFTVTPFVGARLTAYDTAVVGATVTRDGIPIEITKDEVRLRRFLEVGSDFEARASRVFDVGGLGGVDAVLHSIEPRATYTLVTGNGGDARLPRWTDIDLIPDSSSAIVYSLTNRVRARTVAPEGTEPGRWELLRFVMSQAYDFRNETRPFSNLLADLIVNPGQIFYFRADTSWNVYGDGFQTGNTDLGVTVAPVVASVGTRYSKPDRINFLQGNLHADLTRYVTARFNTNWDTRTDTFVENRFGLDIKFQCWAFTIEYVSRHRNEDEFRFSVNLLGVGAPLSSSFGFAPLGGGGGAAAPPGFPTAAR